MAIQKVLRLLLILPMLLMLTVASGQAQEPRPEQPLAGESPEAALGSAFTYQGLLNKDGSPANGTCDFTFSLWNAAPPLAAARSARPSPKPALLWRRASSPSRWTLATRRF